MARRFFQDLQEQLDEVDLENNEEGLAKPRLLPLRTDIYRILKENPVMVYWEFLPAGNPLICSLAIWFLSKSASRFELLRIDSYRNHHSPMVRKHVAKALRALEAWQSLAGMASDFPADEAVQFFAKPAPNRVPYDQRLAQFSKRVAAIQPSSAEDVSHMPLWFLTDEWKGTPAKTVEFMRRILIRIQRAVHGNGNNA